MFQLYLPSSLRKRGSSDASELLDSRVRGNDDDVPTLLTVIPAQAGI